jgi:cell division protein FtsI/penicillin-binding protein 2
MRSNHASRTILIFCFFLVLTALFSFKLYNLQIIHGKEYRDIVDRKFLRTESDFDRGSIFMTDKTGKTWSLATVRDTYSVVLDPLLIKNEVECADKLVKILPNLDKNSIISKAKRKEIRYVLVAEDVEEGLAQKVEDLKIQGLMIEKRKKRFYPAKDMASRVVGFVGYKDEKLVGRYGLERYYEDTLKRRSGNLYANFFKEVSVGVRNVVSGEKKISGDLLLSIDMPIQSELEKILKDIQGQWSSKLSGGIVMDPKNGEILAMSVVPSFDPNNFSKEKNLSVFSNPLVEGVYELGSIIKPLTVASGLDAGVITPQSTYDDMGFLTLQGRTISNFDKRGRGRVDMQEVLNQSLNTGAAFIALKLGKEKMLEYFKKFGLADETGIDLPGEGVGNLSNLNNGGELDLATASFGQGIALTPIATIRALAALANGGFLVEPHLVREVKYQMGLSKKTYADNVEKPRVISEKTSKDISNMLVEVVDKALLRGKYKMEHYTIAAKTGTAQIAKPDGKGYYDDRYLHSFFGYFPATNPRAIVFLYTIEPQGANYASHTLTEPFMNLAKFLINYYSILPDR